MRLKIKIHWIFKCIMTIVYAYLIYYASSKDTSSISLPPHTDKLIHFVEFGLLCLMTCWTLFSDRIGDKRIYKIIIAISTASLYGVSDEIHQSFTPHRSVEFFDWLADTLGAITTGLLWQMLAYKRQLKEKSLITEKTLIQA